VTRFAASTSYTATVTVVPVTGRTLTGVTANFFTLNGKAATTGNTANAGVIQLSFWNPKCNLLQWIESVVELDIKHEFTYG
jgi:hypothetical protein